MDMGSIVAARDSLKLAADIAKTLWTLKGKAEFNTKIIELQETILAAQSSALDAQSEQSSLLQQIGYLEEEVARVKAWETEKERYKLHEPRNGVFTYILKADAGGSEPSHQICANCYNARHTKSILQEERLAGRVHRLLCHNCGGKIVTQGMMRRG